TAVNSAPDHTSSSQYVQFCAGVPDSTWAKRAGSPEHPFVNPGETRLFAQALSASPEAAEPIYHQIGQDMIDDAIILPMVNPQIVLAYRNGVTGVTYSAC